MRRDQFLDVGGFCETLFTYVEDTDLSLRVWQRGWSVTYVPDASFCTTTSSAATPASSTCSNATGCSW